MKQPIAIFVNAQEIRDLFCENGFKISYKRAREIKNELKEEHSEVLLPDKRVIPLIWVTEKYSDKAYKGV